MAYRYVVYGVSVVSDIPFEFPAEVLPQPGRPCVRFVRGEPADFTGAPADDSAESWFTCADLDGGVYIRWSGLYEFAIDAPGAVVRYRALRDTSASVLQNFLFGQVLSFALIRQDVEPVHAAVVDVGGRAIALLGDCTYGKSTLAASLLRAGCRLVSDDVLVVHASGGSIVARAGTGRIKLMPDSAAAMLGDPSGGVELIPNATKRLFRLGPNLVQPNDVPLRSLVVLPTPDERAQCDRIEIRNITGPEVFCELVKNTFVRYGDDGARLRRNFSANTSLAAAVGGHRLRYPAGIEKLPRIADAIVDYFRQH